MKKSIITIFFSFLAVFNLCSQDAYFNYKQFFTPNHDSYIELYALYPIVNLQGGLNFKLNENKVELDNLNIDGFSNNNMNNFLNDFNFQKKNIFNKIIFRNSIKEFFNNL